MIGAHLPVLLVILPLLAAPLCIMIGREAATRLVSAAVTWTVLGMAVALLAQVQAEGPLRYALGGWEAPLGIEYRVDPLNAFLLVIVSANAAVVLPFAFVSFSRELPPRRHNQVFALFLLCLAGLLGICVTGDAFNIFVFLEISALSSYVLVAMGPTRRALIAAMQYLILGTIGSTFILIGIGLLYMMTGTLNIVDLAHRLEPIHSSRTVLAAFAFLTVGTSMKMALFPVHNWLPNAYAYAPSAVSAFIASTSTKVMFYLLLRFVYTLFGGAFIFDTVQLDGLLLPLALLAVYLASAVALYQPDVKRLLAFSSISQIGYILLGLSLHSETGLTGSIVHLFHHAVIKGGLFLVMGCIAYRVGSAQLADFPGLGRRMPWTMAAFVVGGFGLIGIPGTGGFITKWFLVSAALEQGLWLVGALTLLSSLIAVAYVWRIVETAYFQPPAPAAQAAREAPVGLLIPTWILIGATVVFGLYGRWPVEAARQAAQWLLGGST